MKEIIKDIYILSPKEHKFKKGYYCISDTTGFYNWLYFRKTYKECLLFIKKNYEAFPLLKKG